MNQSNFFGLRYQYRFYKTNNIPDIITGETSLMALNNFQTLELMGRVYPSKRIQIMGFVPYNSFRTTEDGKITHFKSIGDVSLLGNYVILNTGDSISRFTRQSLTAGAGIKLPTGEYSNMSEDGLLIPGMQTGSGSVDYQLNVNYTVRQREAGISMDANARINGKNKFDYHFGNRYSGSLKAFYWMNRKKLTFLPSLGISADYSLKDYSAGLYRTYTGGYLVNMNAGMDIYFNNFVIGASAGIPAIQNLSGGLVEAGTSVSLHIQYLFDINQKSK
jgi:hypothetical protein